MSRPKFPDELLRREADLPGARSHAAGLDPLRRLQGMEEAVRGAGLAVPATLVDAAGDILIGTAADTVARKAIGSPGRVLTANANDTDKANWGYPQDIGEQALWREMGYDGVCMSCPIDEGSGASVALVDGRVVFQAIYLPYRKTLTGVWFWQVVQGTSTMTTAKVGLYTHDGTNMNRVAVSANDTTLFKGAASTLTKKAFSGTYDAQPGLYYVALFADWSVVGTAPTLGLRAAYGVSIPGLTKSRGYTLAAQTDLDLAELVSGMSGFNQPYWVDVY